MSNLADFTRNNEEEDETSSHLLAPATMFHPIASPSTSLPSIQQKCVVIHLLRTVNSKKPFSIEGEFDSGLGFQFNEGEFLCETNKETTAIFIAKINVDIQQNKVFHVTNQGRRFELNKYKIFLPKSKFSLNLKYADNRERFINQPQLKMHHFLFDVDFKKGSITDPPGKDIDLYKQLCLYSYFLCRYGLFDRFDTLAEQFTEVKRTCAHQLTTDDLNRFFECCCQYLSYALSHSPDLHQTYMVICCMTSLLRINRTNLDFNHPPTANFAHNIIDYLISNSDDRFESVSNKYWKRFQDGFIIYFVIHLVRNPDNIIGLGEKIEREGRRKDFANSLLQKLEEFGQPIISVDWIGLFDLIDGITVTLRQLELTHSIELYFSALIRVLVKKHRRNFTDDDVAAQFDQLISKKLLFVDLPSIIVMLKYLEQEKQETVEPMKTSLKQVTQTIENSQQLRKEVKTHLYRVPIVDNEFNDIRVIVSFLGKANLLFDVEKFTLLNHVFKNADKSADVAYFKTGFHTLLASSEISSDINKEDYQKLLKAWSTSFATNRPTLIAILQDLDAMIKALDNHRHQLTFTNYMICLCFGKIDLYDSIGDALVHVRNDSFLKQFHKVFHDKITKIDSERLKQWNKWENPLCRLMKLSSGTQDANGLIRDLINMVCDQIDLKAFELIESTFNEPSSDNFVYKVLFDPCFRSTNLRKKVIDELVVIRDGWEKKGLVVYQIKRWQRLNTKQREIAGSIWKLIGVERGGECDVDHLIRHDELLMKTLIQNKDLVNKSIERYCRHAVDRETYLKDLSDIDKQLASHNVRCIQMPKQLQDLVPLADQLVPVYQLHAWSIFYERNRREQRKSSQPKASRTTASFLADDASAAERDNDKNDIRSCQTILEDSLRILKLFNAKWNAIMEKWRDVPISDLLTFFPHTKFINDDFEIFKKLHPTKIIDDLKPILDYFADREQINRICRGWVQLLAKLDTSTDQNIIKHLTDIPQINPQTSASICSDLSKFFSTFRSKYSDHLQRFIAEYDRSHDLLAFLNTLALDDVENLSLAVNDWEETLVNTKTILDFVVLKRFLIRYNEQLKSQSTHVDRSNFDRISNAFEETIKDEQFQNLNESFRACSASLAAIKRIHLELTDKESAKRKRIADVMRQMNFGFVNQSNRFDIRFESFEMPFSELNELRDRARLIEYSIKNNNHKQDHPSDLKKSKELADFVTFVEIVEKVLKNLEQLNRAGYPDIDNHLIPNKRFVCHENNYEPFVEFSLTLDDLVYKWEQNLCDMYGKYIELTYFIHQQLWTIEDYLYNHLGTLSKNHQGYHLLKFIDIDPARIQIPSLPDKPADPTERLSTIGKILSRYRLDSVSNSKEQQKRVYLVETSDQGTLDGIIRLFIDLDVSPSVNQIFYCRSETSWIEIRAFLYRCFLSQRFHQLIRPENLSALVQDQFVNLLKTLINQYSQHSFQLGIITNVSNTQVQMINALRALQLIHVVPNPKTLMDDGVNEQIKRMIGNRAMLFTSRISGLGKSHHIRQLAKKDKRNYIKFPINGDVCVDQIASRLQNMSDDLSKEVALHFDIGAISHNQQFNEFLYCLLLFRRFRFGQLAIHVPDNMSIYIELDSSPSYGIIYDKIQVFKLITEKRFNEIDWNAFHLFHPSTIQFVVNYLLALKDDSILKIDINEENMIKHDRPKCLETLKSFFSQENFADFTWVQLSIFISIYHYLFREFSRCGYFLCNSLKQLVAVRKELIEYLLKSVKQFTSLSVEDVRSNQRAAFIKDATQTFSDSIVRWDKAQPFTLVFSAVADPIFVYKSPEDVPATLVQLFQAYTEGLQKATQQCINTFIPDYSKFTHQQFFQRLASLSNKFLNKSICPLCFRQNAYAEQQCQVCRSDKSLLRPNSFTQDEIGKFQNTIANLIESEYIFTPDNFIKMLLIYLRVQSRIPVLIMGETGCGKTALIQCLCQKILDDEMAIFRIHAGVTNEEIITNFRTYIDQAQHAGKIEKRLWVFLDEFNTTSNIGLIKEITCERTLLGEPLPDNLVLLGACNPQRQKQLTAMSNKTHVGIKKDLYEVERLKNNAGVSLLYTVVPVPETMLEYVWDYGYLDSDIEMKYIQTMLNGCVESKTNPRWFAITAKLISESQRFFRKFEDVSSVSLRDVARFCRLYNWFRNSALKFDASEHRDLDLPASQRATLVALLLCYYFRISTSEDRQRYANRIEDCLRPVMTDLSQVPNFLIKVLEHEQMKLINRMDLPAGTAKNRTLIDNIFVLLVCTVNRIPVVISGKPGCSKTSAVQILISNLRGKNSSDPYFRTLPELMPVSYQGSQNCTSDSIIKVFQRADKYLDVKGGSHILPVIVFDEIGLAELSPHNPLKVLHSKLEVETCQYGFVGLSNWRLDASKMNRALYLSCAEPTIEDLKLTATKISEAIISATTTQSKRIDSRLIEGLAVAYHDLYQHLQNDTQNKQYENYFGLRDFYALIKGVVKDLIDTDDPYRSIRRQLIINFDGVLDGSQRMWFSFCQYIRREDLLDAYACPTFKDLLDQRLESRQGRYLMLIAENESAIDYIERYIIVKHQSTPVRTLIGSCFEDDLISGTTYTENYNYRVLMDVILYAETHVTLMMRRMGHLYDNLYDLFNQNFAIVAEKQFCRIALGALYHPQCLVHDQFYCVVLIHKDDLAQCDPPFLNRFEKHVINMESLIHQRHWSIAQHFLADLLRLLPTDWNKHFPLLQHLFVDYSPDYICNLVIDAFHELQLSTDDDEHSTRLVIEYCREKLLRTSSFDLPLILASTCGKDHPLIDQYYAIHSHLSFSSVIDQALQNDHIPHQIIYTYTQLYHSIDHLSMDQVDVANLNTFKTELELTHRIKQHYQGNDHRRLLLLRLDYHQEHQYILLVKHILLNSKPSHNNRGVWIICHLQRYLLNQTHNDVLFNGWSSLMINDLNDPRLLPKDLLLTPSYRRLVSHSNHRLTDTMFNDLVDRCCSKLRYTVWTDSQLHQINTRRKEIIDCLTQSNGSLRKIFRNHIDQLIDTTTFPQFKDWRQELLTNEIIIGACRSVNDALHSVISNFYETFFLLLIFHLEKYSFIDTLISIEKAPTNHHKILEELWTKSLLSVLGALDKNIVTSDNIEIPLVFGFHYPCARMEYEVIRTVRQSVYDRQVEGVQDEEELNNFAMDKLMKRSTYESMIEQIFDDQDLFQWYYHDLLLLVQAEIKLDGISVEFIKTLFLSNQNLKSRDYFKHFFGNWNEFLTICQLFQIGFRQIDEKKFVEEVINQQMVTIKDPSDYRNGTSFYQLVLTDEHVCLVSPKSSSNLAESFDCDGDSFIEVSLMNLVEYLISQPVINTARNIEQLTIVYSLVADSVLRLSHYSVNNLEKLRSFLSLLRCITMIVPSEKATIVFKNACTDAHFNGTFSKCKEIQHFIDRLKAMIEREINVSVGNKTVENALVKLGTEFLKNWLVDHPDEYPDVLSLLSNPNNYLWRYSAKIFSYMDRRLELLSFIEQHQGRISFDDDPSSMSEKYEGFDQVKDPANALAHMLVTRFHMRLILTGCIPAEIVQQYSNEFIENITTLATLPNKFGIQLISLISWLKFYAQLYSSVLIGNQPLAELEDIDKVLTREEYPCCKTIKLFVIKQICQMRNISFERLQDIMSNRRVVWIQKMIGLSMGERTLEIRQKLTLPTPLFEHHDEFLRVDRILTQVPTVEEMRTLISECRTNPHTAYAFYTWFIHFYARFAMETDAKTAPPYLQWFETELSKEVNESFQSIGSRFLLLLCTNFKRNDSYFSLNQQMKHEDIHYRFVLVNLIAVLLAYRTSLLFNSEKIVPKDYTEYIQNSICLPGLLTEDPVVQQMIRVRHEVKERLDHNEIHQPGKFIYQCSDKCLYTFYFANCGVPVARSRCQLCGADIGAANYGRLIERDPPQIKRTITDAFTFIDRYLNAYQQKPRFGYQRTSSANESHAEEKSEHLDRPISYRFMHFLTHTVLLFLNELGLLMNFPRANSTFYRNHVEKDYSLLNQQLGDIEQKHTWFYKILNHLTAREVPWQTHFDNNHSVIQFEKYFEANILFPHLQSVVDEVSEYKNTYNQWTRQNRAATLKDFLIEVAQDERIFPFLTFFSKTNIYTKDPIIEFKNRLNILPSIEERYPVTNFLMKRLDECTNIQHLYPIVTFINHLIERFNHRIKRNEAAEKSIETYLTYDEQGQMMRKFYNEFLAAWYQLKLDEVRFGCQTTRFELISTKEEFAEKTKLAMLLLNTSKDASSILLAACLRTIAELQNEIVTFFQTQVLNRGSHRTQTLRKVHLQSIRQEHILHLDQSVIIDKLTTEGLTINHEYGKGEDIIYDYEEIELTLRNLIGSLPIIDTENLRCLNYQFELYSENVSLINDVRARVKQEPLDPEERKKLKSLLTGLPNDDLLDYLGSLDYVFTYLRNIDDDPNYSSLPIQNFVEKIMRSSTHLNDNVVRRQPFAGIHLRFIIDLYEWIEEIAFDKVIRHYVKPSLSEQAFSEEHRLQWIDQFSKATWKNERIAPSLRSFDPWIGILKRLMIRVLSNTSVSLDVPMQLYLERTDLWPGSITFDDIQTIEVPDEILLQHTFVILQGLEHERKKRNQDGTESIQVVLQNNETQIDEVVSWVNKTTTSATKPKQVPSTTTKPSARKIR